MNNSGADISRYEIRHRIFKESIPGWVRLNGLEIGPLPAAAVEGAGRTAWSELL